MNAKNFDYKTCSILDRFDTARCLASSAAHLSLQSWKPTEIAAVDMMIFFLQKESKKLIDLGLSELKHEVADKEVILSYFQQSRGAEV